MSSFIPSISSTQHLPGRPAPRRVGASYLEVQVAMVMLSIGMAGLYSMSVVQTRHASRLAEILPANEVAALNQADLPWARKLGVYASIDATVLPAAPLTVNPNIETIIDNQSGGMDFFKGSSDWYGWTSWSYSPSYLGNSHYHYSIGRTGSYAQFRASSLPAGDYEVYITYPALGSLGSAIPCRVYDDTSLLTTVNVNQRVATSEFSHSGKMWDRLGVFRISSGTVRVRLMDGPTSRNYILADAILVRSVRPPLVVSVAETGTGGATATLEPAP